MNPGPHATTCRVLHHDQWVLAVEKPSGHLSHPNRETEGAGRCAFEGPYDEAERRFDSPAGPVWLVHRLDRGTSGVLLAALDETSAARCRASFEQGAVEKRYVALVAGLLPPQGLWKDALEETRARSAVRVKVRPGAPPNAESRFQVLASSRPLNLSLLDIGILTGRTHQIRVQAAFRNHPLLGDDVYGDFGLNHWARRELGLRRLFLHAASLALPHPATGRPLALTAPMPEELLAVLEKLRFRLPGTKS